MQQNKSTLEFMHGSTSPPWHLVFYPSYLSQRFLTKAFPYKKSKSHNHSNGNKNFSVTCSINGHHFAFQRLWYAFPQVCHTFPNGQAFYTLGDFVPLLRKYTYWNICQHLVEVLRARSCKKVHFQDRKFHLDSKKVSSIYQEPVDLLQGSMVS